MAVTPEAILCTKNAAERATSAAFALLIEMGRATMRWNKDSRTEQESIEEYIGLVVAGLAGSPQLVSCTVASLTCVLYEFRGDPSCCSVRASGNLVLTVFPLCSISALLSADILQNIVEATCILLKAKSKVIVESALTLVKSLLVIADKDLMAQFLKQLVGAHLTFDLSLLSSVINSLTLPASDLCRWTD